MELKDGSKAELGDVIRWNCWDNDDFTTWNLTGIYTRKGVLYMGGGVDFGLGIGQLLTVDEVVSESENNDAVTLDGIEKIGIASDLAGYIKKYGTATKKVKCLDCNSMIDHATAPMHDCS